MLSIAKHLDKQRKTVSFGQFLSIRTQILRRFAPQNDIPGALVGQQGVMAGGKSGPGC